MAPVHFVVSLKKLRLQVTEGAQLAIRILPNFCSRIKTSPGSWLVELLSYLQSPTPGLGAHLRCHSFIKPLSFFTVPSPAAALHCLVRFLPGTRRPLSQTLIIKRGRKMWERSPSFLDPHANYLNPHHTLHTLSKLQSIAHPLEP